MTISSPRRALENTMRIDLFRAVPHNEVMAKREERPRPNGWPVAKRMRRLEPSRRESREVWQEKTFVPRPQATHANAVSRLNLASIIRPCTARGNLSVADDKSKEKRELRPFKPVVTDRPSIGINLRTDIHQSCAG